MNTVWRRPKPDEEIAKIQEIVDRHAFPPFLTGYDVRLGEFDGEPALWVEFKLADDITTATPEYKSKLSAIIELQAKIRQDLLDAFDDRYPYFRLKVNQMPQTSSP